MIVLAQDVVAPGGAAFLGSLGPTAAVVLVVWYFLKHQADQAALSRKSHEDLMARVEAIEKANRDAHRETADQFSGAVAEFRAEHRKTVNDLLVINRETVQTMGGVSGRVGELGVQVTALGQGVSDLKDAITELKVEVSKKEDKRPAPG